MKKVVEFYVVLFIKLDNEFRENLNDSILVSCVGFVQKVSSSKV